jgi:hypothetical protein
VGIAFVHEENIDAMQRGLLDLTMRENFNMLVHFNGPLTQAGRVSAF